VLAGLLAELRVHDGSLGVLEVVGEARDAQQQGGPVGAGVVRERRARNDRRCDDQAGQGTPHG
jgi:hypothetical protein